VGIFLLPWQILAHLSQFVSASNILSLELQNYEKSLRIPLIFNFFFSDVTSFGHLPFPHNHSRGSCVCELTFLVPLTAYVDFPVRATSTSTQSAISFITSFTFNLNFLSSDRLFLSFLCFHLCWWILLLSIHLCKMSHGLVLLEQLEPRRLHNNTLCCVNSKPRCRAQTPLTDFEGNDMVSNRSWCKSVI
jgi:hypothetical protein